MAARNASAIGMMRAITDHATSPSSHYALVSVSVRAVDWRRNPDANPQVAYVEMSDGTWLTVTVEQSEEKPR
jgi:hypothetical protein